MPALLLHMTLARKLAEDAEPTTLVAREIARAPGALLLGSILPDLPYHARFPVQVARHLLGRDYLASEWGDVFHTRGTGQIALALIAHTRRANLQGDERARVLALIAGYLSHHTVDRIVHPAINQLVRQEREADPAAAREPWVRTHERLERWQSLFFHEDRLGQRITGGPYGREIVGAMEGFGLGRPRLAHCLWSALRAANLEVHGRAPTRSDVRDWLRGTTMYSLLISSPAGRMEYPRQDTRILRERCYQGPGVDLVAPLEAAQAATLDAWRAADQALRSDRITTEVRRVFLERVPDVDLGTGG